MEYPMNERPTVADYIVRRLAREGITDCFGVSGDFAFKLCDAVARSEAIRWVGRRLDPLARLFDADDHLRRRRAVRAQRRDGGQGRAVVRVPHRGYAEHAQSAG